MRNEWIIPDRRGDSRIGKYGAVKNRISGELTLFGKFGEIWLWNDKIICVLIRSVRVAKKHLPEAHWPVMPGDEVLIRVPIEELDNWVKHLRVKRNRNSMVRIANEQDSV